jgi:hypothetical protein
MILNCKVRAPPNCVYFGFGKAKLDLDDFMANTACQMMMMTLVIA